MFPKPDALARAEDWLGGRFGVHPHALSALKLFVVTPLLLLTLQRWEVFPGLSGLLATLLLFGAFGALDYLDGVVARARGLESAFGRVFDRLTDYPLLLGISWFSLDVLPAGLVLAKVAVDLMLLALFLLEKGSTENRLRTGLSYTTLLALLLVTQGFAPRLVTPGFVEALLVLSIVFSSTVALFNLGVIQKRFIADALSGANLLCGVFSMVAAFHGRFEVSLALLLVGAAFDGLDGAAARRWGGTRFGVYSDDIADGVNYGIAPGVALAFALGGAVGVVVGAAYAIFTLSRLVYFTLQKDAADPNWFSGVPSTVGGILVLCALVVFPHEEALLGLFTGVACAQMVSFDALHKHLGRAAARHPRRLVVVPFLAAFLLAAGALGGVKAATAFLLVGVLGYAFLPTLRHFAGALRRAPAAAAVAPMD